MGDKMRALADIMDKDNELRVAVLQEMEFGGAMGDSMRLFRCLEDPDVNAEVRGMLLKVLAGYNYDAFPVEDKEVDDSEYYRRVTENFRAACVAVGIELGE